MKLYGHIILGVFILFLFSQCNSSKNVVTVFEEHTSFTIEKAEFIEWIGGVEGARGTLIEIIIDKQDIGIDTIYFRNHTINPEISKLKNNRLQIIGNISKGTDPDQILHKDSKEEYGNEPPVITPKFNFELASNELVIRYLEKRKVKYLKIKLTKGKRKLYQ